MDKPLKIFITYSHKNTSEKEELITRLALLKREGIIDIWHDNEILPGDKWRDAIFSNLADSDLLFYLTSAHSLDSENCNKELAAALNAEIRVIPIILESCDWLNHQLSDFQALPDRGHPISKWEDESDAWQNVVEGIRKVVDKMQAQAADPPPSDTSERDRQAELVFQHGNILAMLGQLEMAIAVYSHVLHLKPNYASAYNNRGIVYGKKGDFDNAIKDFSKAIQLKPDYANAYNGRGFAYASKDDFDNAIENFDKAIQLNRHDAKAYYNRGTAYFNKDDVDNALEDYNRSVKLNPNDAKTYYNRGFAYASKDDFDNAIKDYTKVIYINPCHADAYNSRGAAYAHRGDFDNAIQDYNTAIRLNPRADTYNNRGNAYYQKGKLENAIRDYNTAIRLNPSYVVAYNNRGNLYAEKGKIENAIRDYNTVIGLEPDFSEAYYNRGNAYHQKGELDSAIQDYTTAIRLTPRRAEVYNNRGVAHTDKKDFDNAIQDYNMLIQLNPHDAKAYNNRGFVYFNKKDSDNAIKDYTSAMELDPQFALAYYNRGEVWLREKAWDKAKADFTTAKRLGVDIIAMFHNSYKDVETYQKNQLVKLPEDLALLLTQRRRDRYPKLKKVLDADGNPLESPDVVNLREQLRNVGPPLSEYINAKSAFGINTTPTEVFVVDKTTRDELIGAHPASADILKPFLHGQDIRRWYVDTPQQWLIFTHRGITIDDYPAILKYLEKHKESLQKRKGKQAWYELQASHRDVERFAQRKLVCPNIYNHHTFAVDTEGFYYGNTSYLIPTQEKWLCGLLNSRTVEWFYSQVSNQLTIDPLRARSGYIQQIPIPDITPVHKALIAKIVDYLICLQQQPEINSEDLKYARDHVMLGYFERVIDGLIYEAYLPVELHKSDKVFLQPLLDEALPSIEEIQGDKMSAFRDIFERLYDRMHLVRRHLYYLDVIKPIRVIQGKL